MHRKYFYLFLLIGFGWTECKCDNGIKGATNYTAASVTKERFQRILRRKKRFLLFPPGAAIVTTMSFTKTLVPRSPSGINLIGEFDIFYPLQTVISDWYPTKVTRKPLPPPPPPEGDYDDDVNDSNPPHPAPPPPPPRPPPELPPPPPQRPAQPAPPPPLPSSPSMVPALIPSAPPPTSINGPTRLPTDAEIGIPKGPQPLLSDPNFNVGKHPGEIYVDDKKQAPPRRYDENYYSPDFSSWEEFLKIIGNYDSRSQSHAFDEDRLWQNHPNGILNPVEFSARKPHTNSDQFYSNYQRWPNNQSWNDSQGTRRNKFESKTTYRPRVSYRYRGSRERRDIYQQLETFTSSYGFDTRACILRMICEAKHYLLPPGKSLFQDIFRILFTLPLEDGYHDDYSLAQRSTEAECETEYAKNCRYSILGFLLSKERPIF